jgi:hypothetical protein
MIKKLHLRASPGELSSLIESEPDVDVYDKKPPQACWPPRGVLSTVESVELVHRRLDMQLRGTGNEPVSIESSRLVYVSFVHTCWDKSLARAGQHTDGGYSEPSDGGTQ